MNTMVPLTLKTTCLNLRHKLMYVDARQASPGMVDDQSDTRVFFCIRTCDSLGPDSEPVGPRECTESRGCYCGSC